MTKSSRNRVGFLVAVLALCAYGRVDFDSSSVHWWVGFAAVGTVLLLVWMAFVELPKDPWPRLRRTRG